MDFVNSTKLDTENFTVFLSNKLCYKQISPIKN